MRRKCRRDNKRRRRRERMGVVVVWKERLCVVIFERLKGAVLVLEFGGVRLYGMLIFMGCKVFNRMRVVLRRFLGS